MSININSNVNFKANFIMSTNIEKRSHFLGKKTLEKVAFVEFDKESVSDQEVLLKLCKKWQPSYVEDIAFNFTTFWGKIASVFFLTSQKNDFENLSIDKILGALAICPTGPNNICLDFLQVNPLYLNNKNNKSIPILNLFSKNYKYCGTSMLNCIKKLYPDKNIDTLPAYDTIDFYKKNGFIKKYINFSSYIFMAEKQD